MKKYLLFFLVSLSLVIASGCSQVEIDVAQLGELEGGIYWMEYPFGDSYHYNNFGDHFSESDRMLHNELQERMGGISIEYPIDTDKEIQIYAWGFYDIAVELQLLNSEFLPYCVECYPDGIVYVMFLQPCDFDSYYDGPTPILYFSSVDGHIINFEVKYSD